MKVSEIIYNIDIDRIMIGRTQFIYSRKAIKNGYLKLKNKSNINTTSKRVYLKRILPKWRHKYFCTHFYTIVPGHFVTCYAGFERVK